MKPIKILHIHQDYPDGSGYPYTKAVANLLHASPSLDHFVVSINRTSNPFKVKVKTFEEGLSVVYFGIPLPFFYIFTLWITHWLIVWALKSQQFDLIHGHKLTTEGYLAFMLSKKRGVPYIISVRGGSDVHNSNRCKMHRPLFAKIFRQAKAVLWVSPWAKATLCEHLGLDVQACHLFPNICDIELKSPPAVSLETQTPHFISVVNFSYYERKGVLPLLDAFKQLSEQGFQYKLDVYGYGDESNKALVEHYCRQLELNNTVHFHGAIAQHALRQRMVNATGLLLPSLNETFGMAYIEALSVGIPIVYMANTGVDGFFDEYDIGVRCQTQDVEALAQAVAILAQQQSRFKAGLHTMWVNRYLERFTATVIAQDYNRLIQQVLQHESR